MGHAIGEIIRQMQQQGAGLGEMIGLLSSRPQVLQQIANVDARSVSQVLNMFQQLNQQNQFNQINLQQMTLTK